MDTLKAEIREVLQTNKSTNDCKEKVDFNELDKERNFFCEQSIHYKKQLDRNELNYIQRWKTK